MIGRRIEGKIAIRPSANAREKPGIWARLAKAVAPNCGIARERVDGSRPDSPNSEHGYNTLISTGVCGQRGL